MIGYNMLKRNSIILVMVLFSTGWTSFPTDLEAEEISQFQSMLNGVNARIHKPEVIIETMTHRDSNGRLVLDVPGGSSYLLVEDISDPVIFNKGDGSFHPLNEEFVVAALREIEIPGVSMDIDIDIYILPLPRKYFLASSTMGAKIFLSPGVFESGYELTAFTVTHEFGHCVQDRYLPVDDSGRWTEYLDLRGILDEPRFFASAVHANRPKEIFAEDFRFLFGGDASRYSGTIENPDIALPTQVPGLDEFFVSLVSTVIAGDDALPGGGGILALSNYPNPFIPSTTIRAFFDDGPVSRPVEINVYGADGRFVKSLYRGDLRQGRLDVVWDGRNDNGSPAGSGVYFYSVRSGDDLKTGKMILLK